MDLIWGSGLQSDFDCTQYHQHSLDTGKTWGVRQSMLTDMVGCPDENQFFDAPDGLTILMTTVQEDVFLLAWDGKIWSRPQAQAQLSGFTDLKNFDTVNFRCRQATPVNGDSIVVVGCDTIGDGDIWLISRKLGDLTEWFPPLNVWSEPVMVATDLPVIWDLETVADPNGRLHVFWNQTDANVPGRVAVHYARLDEDGWHPSVRVFSSLDNRAGKPSVAIDARGRLVATWASTRSGELFFSWADLSVANNRNEWVDPIPLPILQKSATDPEIVVAPSGTLFVVYAIQLNEDRGIYLTNSSDGGDTWSAPVRVFDARQAEWSMVERPKLVINLDNSMSIIWERGSLPGDIGVMGLYYSSSTDGGNSWAPVVPVVEDQISWSDIVIDRNSNIYRFWQNIGSDAPGIWYDVSIDAGKTWRSPENLSGLGEAPGPVSLAKDITGGVQLVQIVERVNEKKVLLNHWEASDNSLVVSKNLELPDIVLSNVVDIAASVLAGNRLAVVYTYATDRNDAPSNQMTLLYTSRGLDSVTGLEPTSTPAIAATAIEPVSPTATASPEVTATGQVQATASEQIQTTPAQGSAAPSTGEEPGADAPTPPGRFVLPGGAWGGLALGTGVAVLIVAITFGLAIRRTRRSE